MNINWQTIAEGTVTGIAATLVIALYLLLRGKLRSFLLKRAILQAVYYSGLGYSLSGVTLRVQNKTDKPFIVRGLAMASATTQYRLLATGKVEALQLFPGKKLSKEDLAELRAGKAVSVRRESIMNYEWNTAPPSSGFATILPYTSQEFLLPAELIVDWDGCLKSVITSIEYIDWSDSVRLLHIVQVDDLEQMIKTLCDYKEKINSGEINAARTRFSLVLVPLKRGTTTEK